MTLLDVPVVPDAETAREWARTELADPVYHQDGSLLKRLLEWVWRLLGEVTGAGAGLDARLVWAVVLGLVVLVALLALWIAGPVRRSRRAAFAGAVFEEGDERTAAELRRLAEEAAARGDWRTAVLARFRAVVRTLEERVVLDERPGRTAHEAAVEAGAALPGLAAQLLGASAVFDEVCYGEGTGSPQEHEALRALDDAVRTAEVAR